ncbi:hypothetical protein EDB87DRAFT_1646648 [Lactarius vividus]|nr:hypothetical protein EDB87DRAFT_1646648 [Lactarius vividus]
MPYVSVTTQGLGSPVLIPFDSLARSQLHPNDPLTRRLSCFLLPQSKYDLQKRQLRHHTPPRAPSPNHRPLKPSLKCSRARRVVVSEPPSPPGSKSVRFKDTDGELESVCFFRATGRPYSISHPRSHSDTETETDNTDSAPTVQRGGRATFTLTEISPIPSPDTPPTSNVHLESLTLIPTRPPFLRGTVRVRNLAFEKAVVARFTTDGWTTFTIPLEAPPLYPRTLRLAVRYAVPGTGEWWDNNGGADFRAVLAPKATPHRPAPVPGPTPAFGVGARPRRALVGVCRANVAAAKAYAYPTLAQCSAPVPPVTNQSQWLRVT